MSSSQVRLSVPQSLRPLMYSNSPTLSGASASTSKGDRTYDVYRASAIRDLLASQEGSKLVTEDDCRLAMVLIAVLAGGDYVPEGIETFGEYYKGANPDADGRSDDSMWLGASWVY